MRGLKRNTLYHINEHCSVAPYVGAWIETTFVDDETGYEVSHPTWVRGLKLENDSFMAVLLCRTLRGCVD